MFDLNDFDETLPGAVRIRREAHGGELHDRRAQQRVQQGGRRAPRRWRRCRRTASRWPSSPRCARWTSGTRACPSRTLLRRDGRRGRLREGRRQEAGDDRAEERGEDAPRRRTRATACRRCRSSPSASTADTGSSASRRWSFPLRDLSKTRGYSRGRARADGARAVPRIPGDARRTIDASCWSGSSGSTWPARSSGVGSVGTRAFIVPVAGSRPAGPAVPAGEGSDRVGARGSPPEEPLRASPASVWCRASGVMQAASDIFLGWTKGAEADRFLYWRQLRDMKGSAVVEAMAPATLASLRTGLRRDAGAGARVDRATRSPSPRTSARRRSSTSRSATSRNATQTRTIGTTRRSAMRSAPAGSRPSRASESAHRAVERHHSTGGNMQAETEYDTYESSGAAGRRSPGS